MIDFSLKENRLNNWNEKKKEVQSRININFKDDNVVKFRIQPWSIWWFDIGENIGTETSCHFSQSDISYLRPCIIVSTNNFNKESYHKKVIIMPLTSVKEDAKVKHFHYKLDCNNYKGFFDKKQKLKYIGLEKDSLVICNDIKTIDTKRLYKLIYPSLIEIDINNIKEFVKKYFGV